MGKLGSQVGSLEDLIAERVASAVKAGVDTPAKVGLVEAAWSDPECALTLPFISQHLNDALATTESMSAELDQLIDAGVFILCDGGSGGEDQHYCLTPNADTRGILASIVELMSDSNFRTRTIAQLRFLSPLGPSDGTTQ